MRPGCSPTSGCSPRRPDGGTHEYTYADLRRRSRRLAGALAGPRHRARRPRGHLRLEPPPASGDVLRHSRGRGGLPHPQRAALSGTALLHRQSRRRPGGVHRRFGAPALRAGGGRRPRRRAPCAGERAARRRDRAAERAALRGPHRRGRRRLPVAVDRRAHGDGPVLHQRHHRRPQGGPLQPPVDVPAHPRREPGDGAGG